MNKKVKAFDLTIWSKEIDPDYENYPYEFLGKISGRGYVCNNCRNSTSFIGSYYLYRLYGRMENEEPSYEFEFEIPVPLSLSCPDCPSSKLLVEYSKGWCFEFEEDKLLVLVGDKRLISFDDEDGDYDLFELLGCDPDSIMKATNYLDQMQEWKWNDFESFEKNRSAVVRILAKGELSQTEDGLADNNSTYKSLEFSI